MEGGMQWLRSSYSFVRTSMTRAGDCSWMIMSATLWQYVSQSGFAMLSALEDKSVLCA